MELTMSVLLDNGSAANPDVGSRSYLGTECHGILRPFSDDSKPHNWPIGPSILSGKVLFLAILTAMQLACRA